MDVPKKFKLGLNTYTVETVRHTEPRGTMGTVYYDKFKIEVATHSGRTDRSFKKEEISDTFWHEVTHAILKDMDHKLWNNERFVTEFARRLNQVILTARH